MRRRTMLTFMGTGCISKTLRKLVSNNSMMSELIRSHRGLSGLLQRCNRFVSPSTHSLAHSHADMYGLPLEHTLLPSDMLFKEDTRPC